MASAFVETSADEMADGSAFTEVTAREGKDDGLF
jgi:hypothetical protein